MNFQILNMTCGGCVRGVTRAIQALDPGADIRADLETKSVEVTTTVGREQLVVALAEAGFTAR